MPQRKMQAHHRDPLPENFSSLEEFWAFWDTHSTADYEDLMEDVDVHVDIRSSKIYCAVAKDIIAQVRTQARRQGVSTETLINLWLREKVTEAAQSK
ncbi:MAG: CopG family antitoxin [Candidatus Methylomirabilales bacterium]